MKNLFKTLLFLNLCWWSVEQNNASEQPDVTEIIRKANLAAYYSGADGRAEVEMIIKDSNGRTRNREFVILRRTVAENGPQKYYVYFNRPADVRKMVFMVWKHIDKDDDRWLYLPALDLVKRIAASDKRSSFVGSDFLYEDVSGRSPEADNHELTEHNEKHYVIKSTPKDKSSVRFSYYKIWISNKTFLPEKAEYYDRNDNLYRTVEALRTENIQGFPTTVLSEVKNLETGSTTTLKFKSVKYNIGLDENIFTERFLRRPPKEARQ
jgi:outer membrane lipoprotein-sorting protein